jgi:hypothetical protein
MNYVINFNFSVSFSLVSNLDLDRYLNLGFHFDLDPQDLSPISLWNLKTLNNFVTKKNLRFQHQHLNLDRWRNLQIKRYD